MKTFNRVSKISMIALMTTSLSVRAYAGASAAATAASGIATSVAIGSMGAANGFRVPCTGAPPNIPACALMGLSLAQVAASLLSSGKSKQSASALSSSANGGSTGTGTGVDGTTTTTLTGTTNPTGTTDAQDAAALTDMGLGSLVSDYKSLKDAAAKAGVVVSPDGSKVTTGNGQSFSTASFGSSDAMKKAGMTDGDIAGIQDAMDEGSRLASAYKSKVGSLTNDQGGGGGGGLGSGGGDGVGSSGRGGGDAYGLRRGGAGNGKDKGVAGMSKKLGNDNIGVSGDDIFDMISRRYQARDKVDNFLKN